MSKLPEVRHKVEFFCYALGRILCAKEARHRKQQSHNAVNPKQAQSELPSAAAKAFMPALKHKAAAGRRPQPENGDYEGEEREREQ